MGLPPNNKNEKLSSTPDVQSMETEAREERYVRSRSFRDEDYSSSRRVFLYSYPLQWGGEDADYEEYKEGTVICSHGGDGKKHMKELIVSLLRWSEGKALVLRRFKHKLRVYIIACLPVGFKPEMP